MLFNTPFLVPCTELGIWEEEKGEELKLQSQGNCTNASQGVHECILVRRMGTRETLKWKG
jgi:hypothetical protein